MKDDVKLADLKQSRLEICTLESKHHCNATKIVITKQFKTKCQQIFQEQKKEYLRAKVDELETKSKAKNSRDFYRGISDVHNCYQPRTNTVKNEKGDLVTD